MSSAHVAESTQRNSPVPRHCTGPVTSTATKLGLACTGAVVPPPSWPQTTPDTCSGATRGPERWSPPPHTVGRLGTQLPPCGGQQTNMPRPGPTGSEHLPHRVHGGFQAFSSQSWPRRGKGVSPSACHLQAWVGGGGWEGGWLRQHGPGGTHPPVGGNEGGSPFPGRTPVEEAQGPG